MDNTVTEHYNKFEMEENEQTIKKLHEEILQKNREVEQKDREIATLRSQVQAFTHGTAENTKNEKNTDNKTENITIEKQKVENNRTEHHQDNINIKNPDGSINMEEATKLVEIINQKKEEVTKLVEMTNEKKEEVSRLENQLKGEINEDGKF